MVVKDIIVYDYEFISQLSEEFSAILDDTVLNNLLEIKKNNKFIRRKSPIRLKYKISIADTWRKKRQDVENTTLEEKLIIMLNSNLNKLSDANKVPISTLIKDDFNKLIKNNLNIEKFINIITDKAMADIIYSKLYSEILFELSTIDNNVSTIILDICDKFFAEINNVRLNDNLNMDNYDELCEIIKQKSKLASGFVFISNLYKYKIVSYEMMKNYYKSLIEFTEISTDEYIGKYIDAIVQIISNCGDNLEKDNCEEFKDFFLDICIKLSKDKDRILPKYRFKLLDICEKYNNYT